MYKKILACVDGSKYSEKAVKHAISISKKYDADLQLIYVVDKSPTINLLDRNETLTLLRKYGKKILEKQLKEIKKEKLDVKTILKEGKVVNEIIDYAKKQKFDLIVVGNKGLGATMRILLGSVSSNLAQNSKVPVLIVK